MNHKKKNDKLDFIKRLKFCFSKDSAKIMKKEDNEKILEEIFISHISDKDIIFGIYITNSQKSVIGK